MDGLQRETLLLICELAILTKGIEADDELFLEGLERSKLDILPLLVVFFVGLTRLLLLSSQIVLLLFPLILLLRLFFLFLADFLVVVDSLFECFIE